MYRTLGKASVTLASEDTAIPLALPVTPRLFSSHLAPSYDDWKIIPSLAREILTIDFQPDGTNY
jgi:hypothetical protein